MLPALPEGLEDVALVELGIAHQGHHAGGRRLSRRQPLHAHVVLHQRGEDGHRHAEAHRAGGDVDPVAVLGARGIGLGAAERPEALELVAALAPEQILDGVEGGAGVGLHRHPVLRLQDMEIKRGEQGHRRGARGLVPAHLEAVDAGPQVVGGRAASPETPVSSTSGEAPSAGSPTVVSTGRGTGPGTGCWRLGTRSVVAR